MSKKDTQAMSPDEAATVLREAILQEEEDNRLEPLLDLIEQMVYLEVSREISAWSASNAAQRGDGRKAYKYKVAENKNRRLIKELAFALKAVIEGEEP